MAYVVNSDKRGSENSKLKVKMLAMSTICFIWDEDLWSARVKLRMGKLFHGEINEVSWAQNNGSPAPNKTSNSLTFGIPLKYPTSMKLYLTGKIGTSPPLKDVGFTNPSGRELIIWIVKFPIAFYNIIRLQRSALNLLLLICSTKVSSPSLSTHCTPPPPPPTC